MVDPKLIDDLARRLAGSLPAGLRTLQDELEQNFRPVLQSALSRFDLVTREEFDVQAAVLAKARKQIDTLLARLEELEAHLAKKTPPSD
ncbi:MAG: accessory factor UbiK family protein [Gammaproteobacteria bacterium]|nr:accessory factor UbiK family protein [Gammaproteobacteria bacterium]NNF60205.1 accessory factor UbiK family protein [Gammaproteobacteria bacterium]NNM21618.1 accessory factor UbiK family protein [Gammaproteobacteria bacterium]